MKINAATQALINEAVSTALTDQALRIGTILRAPEAEGRRELAMTLALNSTVDAAGAVALLNAAPKDNANRDLWLAAMGAEGRLDLAPAHTTVSTDKRAARLEEIKKAGAAVNAARNGTKAPK